MDKEIAIPLAYFLTFTCYGTWLHGAKSTSVDKKNNIPGTDFLSFDTAKERLIKTKMSEDPYLLDDPRRNIVLRAITEVCSYKQWTLLAAHIRTNHVHAVIHGLIRPEQIMTTLKAYASRYLNESQLDNKNNRWTRHGSTQYLWKAEEVEATIQYVIHEQGEPMAVFENKERLLITPTGTN